MVEQIQELVLRFRYIYYDDFRRIEWMPREHQAIVDQIKKGDAAGARAAAEQHVNKLKTVVASDYGFAK